MRPGHRRRRTFALLASVVAGLFLVGLTLPFTIGDDPMAASSDDIDPTLDGDLEWSAPRKVAARARLDLARPLTLLVLSDGPAVVELADRRGRIVLDAG